MTNPKNAPFVGLHRLFSTSIGLDDLFREVEQTFSNTSMTFPPYNLFKIGDDRYRLDMAVAGYDPSLLSVTKEGLFLVIRGEAVSDALPEGHVCIHRSIALRKFERKFRLLDYVVVESASIDNGILSISLCVDIPESHRTRTVPIKTAVTPSSVSPSDHPDNSASS